MILQRSGNSDAHKNEIDGNKIEKTNSVDLLGIHIYNKLTFEDHIFALCNSFIYSNFNYCPLVWHFSSCKSLRKIENIHKHLRMIHNEYMTVTMKHLVEHLPCKPKG